MGILFRSGLWVARWASPRMAWLISGWLAVLMDWLNIEAAQVTRANLAVCFPQCSEQERARMCRSSLQHMALLFFEFAQLKHWPLEQLTGQIAEIEGKALLDELASSDSGALVIVPHYGNWEVLCAFLGINYEFAALYDPPKIGSLEPEILAARKRFEGEMFPIDAGGMRRLLKALHSGMLVVLLPDQVPDRQQGVYAPFFGHPALTMTLAHRLAQKSGHRVLMTSTQRITDERGYHYRLTVEPLIEATAGCSAEDFARVMNASIQRVVERAPEQYQWAYKRFKRPPEAGQGNIYRRQ